mmetsp:Transcript_4629/g.4347  ORF Transcript_4629/g.4347 Transcript_4629/m.4347 type:complete len:109 (+) Transcript_4629:2-328(+)
MHISVLLEDLGIWESFLEENLGVELQKLLEEDLLVGPEGLGELLLKGPPEGKGHLSGMLHKVQLAFQKQRSNNFGVGVGELEEVLLLENGEVPDQLLIVRLLIPILLD